jgi:predicted RNase H-like HicB family nuclease
VYRPTDAGWDATSPDLDGWHATAPTPRMLRTRVEEEVRFALNRPHVRIAHLLPLGAAA